MSGAGHYARIVDALKAASVPDREAADAADTLKAIKDRPLKWMVGVSLAMNFTILVRLLFPRMFQSLGPVRRPRRIPQ